MQITGSNLLLAAQASLQAAQKARPPVAPAASAATPGAHAAAAAQPSQFEALIFAKAPTADVTKPQVAASVPAQQPAPMQRPGSHLDIKV